jgi:hypothetical protein
MPCWRRRGEPMLRMGSLLRLAVARARPRQSSPPGETTLLGRHSPGRVEACTGSGRVRGMWMAYRGGTGLGAGGTFDTDMPHHGGCVFAREGGEVHQLINKEERQ